VIDLANSPSFEDKAVLEFFETSGRNLLAAEAAAGVRRHVALSVVGIDRSDNGYFRAKVAQEKLIETSCVTERLRAAAQKGKPCLDTHDAGLPTPRPCGRVSSRRLARAQHAPMANPKGACDNWRN
jgi:hypothetical protein